MTPLLEGHTTAFLSAIATGWLSGLLVSQLTWRMISPTLGDDPNQRSRIALLLGTIVIAVGLLALSAAPRVPALRGQWPTVWQQAVLSYALALTWIIPATIGRSGSLRSLQDTGDILIRWTWRVGYVAAFVGLALLPIAGIGAATIISAVLAAMVLWLRTRRSV